MKVSHGNAGQGKERQSHSYPCCRTSRREPQDLSGFCAPAIESLYVLVDPIRSAVKVIKVAKINRSDPGVAYW
jgi:hypothetical protein